jgi:hypothetical protein
MQGTGGVILASKLSSHSHNPRGRQGEVDCSQVRQSCRAEPASPPFRQRPDQPRDSTCSSRSSPPGCLLPSIIQTGPGSGNVAVSLTAPKRFTANGLPPTPRSECHVWTFSPSCQESRKGRNLALKWANRHNIVAESHHRTARMSDEWGKQE